MKIKVSSRFAPVVRLPYPLGHVGEPLAELLVHVQVLGHAAVQADSLALRYGGLR